MNPLARPLELPCGVTLKNRIAKAAMSEGLADPDDRASAELATLYGRWSDGGAGLLITGMVMVDRRFLERPGSLVIDDNGGFDALQRMAEAGTRNGNHLWMQLGHPGRQSARASGHQPVSASSVKMKGMLGQIDAPRALEIKEIHEVIRAFARAAKTAKDAGFTGVELQAAHGYLLNQFLSPYTNRRTDAWGGSLENRARFLLQTYRAVRESVGDAFPVAVKLNSSDFQKSGFTHQESAQVARWLCEDGIDLLEISGGTYEQLALFGRPAEGEKRAESTLRREAFFLEYASHIREVARGVPLMVTGGFRTVSFIRDVIERGEIDVVGVARPMCVAPDLPTEMLQGTVTELPTPEKDRRLGPGLLGPVSPFRSVRTLNNQAEIAWFYRQILALSEGREPDLSLRTRAALKAHFRDTAALARRRSLRPMPEPAPAPNEADASPRTADGGL
ncbi:MAG: NADH:flavin oxidoreductase/NADH oxidase family protein [Myxococcota bacterium]